MGDSKVFGDLEDPSTVDSRDWQFVGEEDSNAEEDKCVPYGSELRIIQEKNLENCSYQLFHPKICTPQRMCLRRLSSELKNFLKSHPSYISYTPIGDNLSNLLASIEGPPGTPYEKGIFFIRIDCPDEYPMRPPICYFITKIYHPNISEGNICINILDKEWCPAQTLETLLLSICALLSDPFFNDPLDRRIAEEHRNSKKIFEDNARLWTEKYAYRKKPKQAELEYAGELSAGRLAALNRDS